MALLTLKDIKNKQLVLLVLRLVKSLRNESRV